MKQENLAATTISVFVHGSTSGRSVEVSRVACGLGGVLLNKGAVGIALQVFQTRMCFISSHLAAHQHKVLKGTPITIGLRASSFMGGTTKAGNLSPCLRRWIAGKWLTAQRTSKKTKRTTTKKERMATTTTCPGVPRACRFGSTSKGRRSLSGTQRSLFLPPARGHNEATLRRLGLRREAGEISLEEYARGAQQLVHESMHKLVEDGLMDVVEYNAIMP